MRKDRTINPEAKLASDPCNDRATARPAAASTVSREVVSTPSCCSTAKITTTTIALRSEFTKNDATEGSARPRSSRRRRGPRRKRTANQPAARISTAAKTR